MGVGEAGLGVEVLVGDFLASDLSGLDVDVYVIETLECTTMRIVDMDGTVELVIFDCDGVLADSEALDSQVVSSLLREAGHSISPEEVQIKSNGLADDAMWTLLEKELEILLPRGIRERWEARLLDVFRESLVPTPGLAEAVHELSAENVGICVASNGSLERVSTILDIIGLTAPFGGRIFSATMVAQGKPHPDLFLYAAQQMRISPPRCIVVEDSRIGVQAGLAAGMRVLRFCPDGDIRKVKELGVETFPHMDDLVDLLDLDGPRC